MVRTLIIITLVALNAIQTANKATSRVKLHYMHTNVTIKLNPSNNSLQNVLLLENDSLFREVHYVKCNNRLFELAKNKTSFIRIDLYHSVSSFNLENKDHSVLATIYPAINGYEIQWFKNGFNSGLKQWEMVTINANINSDTGKTYFEKEIMNRAIDRDNIPEDFELEIKYRDKNLDGFIDTKITSNK